MPTVQAVSTSTVSPWGSGVLPLPLMGRNTRGNIMLINHQGADTTNLYVLDASSAKVWKFTAFRDMTVEQAEQALERQGIRLKDCDFMMTDEHVEFGGTLRW